MNLVATNIRLPAGKEHVEAFLSKHPEDAPLKPALLAIFEGLAHADELGSLLQIEEPVDRELTIEAADLQPVERLQRHAAESRGDVLADRDAVLGCGVRTDVAAGAEPALEVVADGLSRHSFVGTHNDMVWIFLDNLNLIHS